MNSKKETERRSKIRASLRKYFLTEQGNAHKEKLSRLQSERMNKYNEYLKSIKDEK